MSFASWSGASRSMMDTSRLSSASRPRPRAGRIRPTLAEGNVVQRAVERSFAWTTRCRRLVKDYERYASTLAGFHLVAFVCLMLRQTARLVTGSSHALEAAFPQAGTAGKAQE